MTDLHTLRLWCQLQLLQGLYRTQQHLAHRLPTPTDPLPVVQLLTPELLEGLGDALLQRTTISVVIQMAIALALQRLANFFAGQPGSENEDLP